MVLEGGTVRFRGIGNTFFGGAFAVLRYLKRVYLQYWSYHRCPVQDRVGQGNVQTDFDSWIRLSRLVKNDSCSCNRRMEKPEMAGYISN